MSDKKAVSFEEVLAECEKDPEFRREYLRTVKDETHKLITENNALRKQLKEMTYERDAYQFALLGQESPLKENLDIAVNRLQVINDWIHKSGRENEPLWKGIKLGNDKTLAEIKRIGGEK